MIDEEWEEFSHRKITLMFIDNKQDLIFCTSQNDCYLAEHRWSLTSLKLKFKRWHNMNLSTLLKIIGCSFDIYKRWSNRCVAASEVNERALNKMRHIPKLSFHRKLYYNIRWWQHFRWNFVYKFSYTKAELGRKAINSSMSKSKIMIENE